MGKNKLAHFAELKTFHNVVEAPGHEWYTQAHPVKGNWRTTVFANSNPLVLELGCGKGEYTVGLARKFHGKNFIGVDIKGARMWRGAKTTVEENLSNAAFLRTRIDFITAFFGANEVDEIWLTFSDPQPLEAKARKRLTSPLFMERYKKIMKTGGIVHVKTDSDILYHYTLEQIAAYGYALLVESNDLYHATISKFDADTREILEIRTHYENIFLKQGKTIKYIKFSI
ncbi:MAG TPA: tRNA (guanosine(46)-N7)-methyltransferase TrmB [Flavobacteriales bacterium]|nr:tRNA (guanosine(46)-N7)-methyltransferase TrmB [Flavobacteriales bacterium]